MTLYHGAGTLVWYLVWGQVVWPLVHRAGTFIRIILGEKVFKRRTYGLYDLPTKDYIVTYGKTSYISRRNPGGDEGLGRDAHYGTN